MSTPSSQDGKWRPRARQGLVLLESGSGPQAHQRLVVRTEEPDPAVGTPAPPRAVCLAAGCVAPRAQGPHTYGGHVCPVKTGCARGSDQAIAVGRVTTDVVLHGGQHRK